MDNEELWYGRYGYLELSFVMQQKALKINSPLSPTYKPGASFLQSNKGGLMIYDRANKPANCRINR